MGKTNTNPSTKSKTVIKAYGGTKAKSSKGGTVGGPGPRQKILDAVARLGRLHNGCPPRDQVALLAGYPNAGTAGWKKMLSFLKKEAYLDLTNKTRMALTDKGAEAAETVDEVTTNDDFHKVIRETIKVPKYIQAFEFLIDGRARSKAELAQELGYPNSSTAGFKKMLSQIRKHAFVGGDKDWVQLKDAAFPFGRPK